MKHEQLAAELAEQYASGDATVREQVARECEEQGVVAVLVSETLRPRGLQQSFVEAMKRRTGGERTR